MGNRFEHLEFDEQPEKLDAEQQQQQTQQQQQQPAGALGTMAMDRHAYYVRAVQTFQRGEFEKALQYFTRALELDRSFVPAWVGQVQMLIELEEIKEADLWADKALELFKGHGDLLAARAVAKARKGKRSDAISGSDAAVHARGSSAYRWLARGEVLLASASSQVESIFERALLEADADWFTGLWAARIYRRYGWYTNALVAARKATESAPQAPFAWYVRGLCERDLAFSAYTTSLGRALELDGTYVAARKALREPTGASWPVRMFRRIRGV